MKKVACLLLVLVLVCSMDASALASVKFDTSVFEDASNIKVIKDDIVADFTYIIMKDKTPCKFDAGYSTYYDCSFYPSIVSTAEGAIFFIFVEFYAKDWAKNDSLTVKIGDKCYTFSGIRYDSQVVEHDEVCESLGFCIGPNSIAFMEDLVEHQDEEIKVRLVGDEYNTDFVMSDSMKDTIVTFYQLYVKAGGT